jgi:rhodanese-related sulfurtransferase
MQGKGQDVVLIDVRPAADFQSEHLPGAINVPRAMIRKAELPKNKLLMLYCGSASCMASHQAAQDLVAQGYTNVSVLDGGLAAWAAKSYPVTTGAVAPAPARVKGISARELSAQIKTKSLLIVDVRPKKEFAAGHLPGAVNIPLEELSGSGLDAKKRIVVYDRLPQRSRAAAKKLQEAGLKVKELSGGIPVWAAMKYPLQI